MTTHRAPAWGELEIRAATLLSIKTHFFTSHLTQSEKWVLSTTISEENVQILKNLDPLKLGYHISNQWNPANLLMKMNASATQPGIALTGTTVQCRLPPFNHTLWTHPGPWSFPLQPAPWWFPCEPSAAVLASSAPLGSRAPATSSALRFQCLRWPQLCPPRPSGEWPGGALRRHQRKWSRNYLRTWTGSLWIKTRDDGS